VNKETARRAARLALGLLLAPHLLGMAATVIGQAQRPSLWPAQVAPTAVSGGAPAPVPTMTDGGADYGG
jgi:hypothetical protein